MNKIIYQDSNDELLRSVRENGEAMTTLIETDTGVKRAASELIDRDLLERYRPTDSNNVLIHLIAMGNSQQYGYNRNGDWFDGPVLEKRASTFVTHGAMYREHNSRRPEDAIGTVKYAAYAPKMQRVEILVHLDRDKDPEGYEMAKKANALNFSMSCKVPNDRCSCCGNEAKKIYNYCDCLRSHMGQWMSDFNKYAFAYNDHPTFFDISKVRNPADRIARHLEYLFEGGSDATTKAASTMCKAASADSGILVPSAVAAMAEGVQLDAFDLSEQLILSRLIDSEEYIADRSNVSNFYMDKRANACYSSYPFALLETLEPDEIEAYRSVRPETLFHEFSKRACMLSFPAFCQYVTGKKDAIETPLFKKAAICLPDIFRSLANSMERMSPCTHMFQSGSEVEAEHDPHNMDLVQKFMDKAEDKFSVRTEPTQRRVVTIIMKSAASTDNAVADFEKAASSNVDVGQARDLAQTYGQYQVRALCDIREEIGEENMGENIYDLVAGANSVLVFDR